MARLVPHRRWDRRGFESHSENERVRVFLFGVLFGWRPILAPKESR
jgi:hypothetical protein